MASSRRATRREEDSRRSTINDQQHGEAEPPPLLGIRGKGVGCRAGDELLVDSSRRADHLKVYKSINPPSHTHTREFRIPPRKKYLPYKFSYSKSRVVFRGQSSYFYSYS
eukprot:scaffold90531_cov30-Tisochrysis_lutea.AAC.4